MAAKHSSELSSYIPGLNGLRALAMISVLVCHSNIALGNLFPADGQPFATVFTKVGGAGWVGVDLFFVLSGFLITRILCLTKDQPNYFKNFYVRRTLRIFPLYYIYAALVLWFLPQSGGHWGSNAWKHPIEIDRASVLLYFYNFRVAAIGHHLPLVNQLWSLAVEEHFYLVWPLVVFLNDRKMLVRITLGGCVFSFLCRAAVLHYSPFIVAPYVLSPCRLDGLLLGSLLAIAYLDRLSWKRVTRMAPYAFALSTVVVLVTVFYQRHFYDFIAPGQLPGVRSA